jgi:hypothetical protein
VTLNRANRGLRIVVGLSHAAPFVATSKTCWNAVPVFELKMLYRSNPTLVWVLPNRRTFANLKSTVLILGPYNAPGTWRVDIVGPVCETSDTLGANRELAPVEVGDLLAVRDAGAYGAARTALL